MDTIGLRLFLPGSERAVAGAMKAERYYAQAALLGVSHEQAKAALERAMQECSSNLVSADPRDVAYRRLTASL